MSDLSNIKVSLVVAIYNSAKFLNKLICSILEQTHKNIEVVLVDDGSPDESGKICDKFAEADCRIKVLHKTNGGCCDARNKGLELITGDFFSIIDGDDWLEPDYVEYLLKLAISNNTDMSTTLNIFTTRDREQIKEDKIEVWSSEKTAAEIIYPKIAIGPWNKLYKTDMVKKNKLDFSVPWSGEGHYFTAMSAQYSNGVAIGRRKVYNYRLNNAESGLTNYKVIMGRNALWNTKNIWEKSIIRTPMIENAINYHIWSCYHFTLKLIIATKTQKKFFAEYLECLVMARILAPLVALKSDVSFRHRLKILLTSLFPIYFAQKTLKQEKKALEKDLHQLEK